MIALKKKYPKQNCGEISKEYDKRYKIWERDSVNEYVQNDLIEDNDGFALFTGPMQCFCNAERKAGKKKD